MKLLPNAIGLLVAVLFIPPPIQTNAALGGAWNDPTNDQYHIQTDEGPERYFRYQTHSGQYRKEKRLEDGTVVGSFGWIDSNGLLRLQDYIADNAGYRILRTKDIYVGRNRPISQAIKAAKKVPGAAGTSLPHPSPLPSPAPTPNLYLPPVSTTTPSPVTHTPNFISTTYLPKVDLSHNSYPEVSSTTPIPLPITSTILPPALPSPSPTPPPATVVISPKTPPYPGYLPSIPSTLAPTTTDQLYATTHRPPYSPAFLSSTTPSSTLPPGFYDAYQQSTIAPINSNSLDYYDSNENPYIHHNGPTYPIDRNGNSYFGRAPNRQAVPASTNAAGGDGLLLGNGYDPQYPQYNGVSVTNDGFRYYIPRAYHEEQDSGYTKAGSFGYIDPFGIRRVVYYNAGPNGFQHRKNNRYVGFNATPYDPRPYKKKK